MAAAIIATAAVVSSCGSSKQKEVDDKAQEQLEQSALTVVNNSISDTTITIGGEAVNYVVVERIFQADTTNQFYMSARVIVPAVKSHITDEVAEIVEDAFKNVVPDTDIDLDDVETPAQMAQAIETLGNKFLAFVAPVAADTITPGYMTNIDIRPVSGTGKYVTYAVYADSYTGGAHGDIDNYYVTFNSSTGDDYDFEDIVKGKKDAAEVRKLLVEAIATSKGQTVDEYITSVKDFTDNQELTVENFPVYHVAVIPEGLVFTYPKYSIAAGFEGCPTYVIPNDQVSKYLAI